MLQRFGSGIKLYLLMIVFLQEVNGVEYHLKGKNKKNSEYNRDYFCWMQFVVDYQFSSVRVNFLKTLSMTFFNNPIKHKLVMLTKEASQKVFP